MPSSYPGALDSLTNPVTGQAIEAVDVGNAYDSIEAMQAALKVYGQVYPHPGPGSFSGDSEDMTATTNWVDVDAFTTKEILNGTILHLQTVGPSKDDRVRKTLSTTKAGAFDFRFTFLTHMNTWTTNKDTWFEVSLSTSGGTYVATALVRSLSAAGRVLEVGTTGGNTPATNSVLESKPGQSITLRITRDGSNVLGFFYGLGTAPLALMQVLDGTVDNLPYDPTSAGTIARVEFSIHTPSGPGATDHQCDAWIDTFESL